MKKKKSRIPMLFSILLAACALPLGYAALAGREELTLLGLIPAVFLAAALTVYKVRARQFEKIHRRAGHMLYFAYSAGEAEEIVAHEMPKIKRIAWGLALLFGGCLMVCFAPFSASLMQADPTSPVWAVWVSLALMPVAGALLAPHLAAARIRRSPCISAVGADYILIANRYPGINDYNKLKIAYADFLPAEQGKMRWMQLIYSYVAMRSPTKIQKVVDVPVPYDKAAEAEAFINEMRKSKGKKKQLSGLADPLRARSFR